ncbi:MAG: hypothetical protein ABI851_12035 [Saprospiraceae bacterium]
MPRYIPFIHNILKAKKGDRFEEQFDFEAGFLTGKSAKAQIRTEYGGSSVLEFISTGSTIVISGNSLTLICPANLFNLEPGLYFYDIQLFTSIADVHTVVEGTFEVTNQITV